MYRHAIIGDLIDMETLRKRLAPRGSMSRKGQAKFIDLMAKRERVYDELCSHGLKEHAADIVHDRPSSISSP